MKRYSSQLHDLSENWIPIVLAWISIPILVSCSAAAPIQRESSGKSEFQSAVFKGKTVTTGSTRPGEETYRVYNQATSGFSSLQSVRDVAERRAADFCERKGRSMESVSETTSIPPYVLGNFPRVEIVFDCIDRAQQASPAYESTSKYRELESLKKLLDSGAITEAEFNSEKAKVLAKP